MSDFSLGGQLTAANLKVSADATRRYGSDPSSVTQDFRLPPADPVGRDRLPPEPYSDGWSRQEAVLNAAGDRWQSNAASEFSNFRNGGRPPQVMAQQAVAAMNPPPVAKQDGWSKMASAHDSAASFEERQRDLRNPRKKNSISIG